MEAGVKSLHEKFWRPEHGDLKPHLEKYKKKMLDWIKEENRKKRLGIDDEVVVLKGLGRTHEAR